MIDPINPGPAGSQGPAGTVVGPPGAGVVDGVLQYGTVVIQQAIQGAVAAIRALLDPAADTVKAAISSAAGSIAGNFNQAETTVQLASARAQTAASQAVAAAAPTGSGGTAQQGVTPGQYTNNVFSYRKVGGFSAPAIFSKQQAVYLATQEEWCFQGSWENFYDAYNFINDSANQLGSGACPLPGGPAGGGPVLPTGTCQQWAVWVFPAGSSSTCSYAYCDGSVPDPSGSGGSKMLFPDQASAEAFANSAQCQTGGTGGGGTQYYGGCAGGKPVTWLSTDPVPTGVTGQVGPFSDATSALAAAGSCSGIGTGTGNGTGSGGPCCDPVTGAVKLPDCIYFDLCDWQKFRDAMRWAIRWGLCDFVNDPECYCKIQDADKWVVEECDGEIANTILPWMGRLGSILTNSGNQDKIAELGTAAASPGPLGLAPSGSPFGGEGP